MQPFIYWLRLCVAVLGPAVPEVPNTRDANMEVVDKHVISTLKPWMKGVSPISLLLFK